MQSYKKKLIMYILSIQKKVKQLFLCTFASYNRQGHTRILHLSETKNMRGWSETEMVQWHEWYEGNRLHMWEKNTHVGKEYTCGNNAECRKEQHVGITPHTGKNSMPPSPSPPTPTLIQEECARCGYSPRWCTFSPSLSGFFMKEKKK